MLAAAKYIGAGLACSGLIGAGAGIGLIFSSLIASSNNSRSPSPVDTNSVTDLGTNSISSNKAKSSAATMPGQDDIALPDITYIQSPLEDGEDLAPLLLILKSLLALDGVELLYILLLMLLLFFKYFNSYGIKFINSLLLKIPAKYLPTKIYNWLNNTNLNKILNFNDKFYNKMFIVILIILLLVKLLNIYHSYQFYIKIDDLIYVYVVYFKKP